MLRAFCFMALALIMFFSVPLTISATPSNCPDLQKGVADAQAEYNKARNAVSRAAAKTALAKFRLSIALDELNLNTRKTKFVQQQLNAALADQAACEAAERDGGPAPLLDCEAVPGRVQQAKDDLAALAEDRQRIVAEMEAARQEEAAAVQEEAAARDAEKQARAALDAARAAAAGCPRHA